MAEGILEFSDWQKLNLRVAQIKKVEDIEGADKLYKLTLDVGKAIGERIICAGIKEYYSKEELKDIVKLLYKTQKAVCTLPFIHEETNKIVHKNMRIGV